MSALFQISVTFSTLQPFRKYNDSRKKICVYKSKTKIKCFNRDRLKSDASSSTDKLLFLGVKNGISGWKERRNVVVNFNNGLNGGGGGGGGGRINSETARVLGNLALAIVLAYLSMSGQLGWVLDAIVSLWLLAVLVPIVGIGAFLWWASRDIVQSNCPNCGNEFQVFKSTLNDEVQLCPFCTQPFSVEDDKFVRDPVKFSNESTIFDQAFSNFSPRTKKGKSSANSVVDVEAEIRDAE